MLNNFEKQDMIRIANSLVHILWEFNDGDNYDQKTASDLLEVISGLLTIAEKGVVS